MAFFDRRTFLKLAGLKAGVLALAAELPRKLGAFPLAGTSALTAGSQTRVSSEADVIVIGAGAFGGWTALNLREMGISVTLLDAFGPGNSRAASGGETRQIRPGYGDREVYTRWVLKAFDLWKARQEEWGKALFLRTGRLILAQEWTEELRATKTVLDKYRVENEVIPHEELVRRFPQMSAEGVHFAFFEPDTGVLKAREACGAVAEAFQKKGGRMVIARAEPGRKAGRRLEAVTLSNGETLGAQSFVFACGPWLPKVFPKLMKGKLATPRRDVFFFGTPPGDERFTYPHFPNFAEGNYYGFPSIDDRGFKVCPTGELTPFDPDSDERVVAPYQVKRARDFLARRFPALKDQPILESRVCQLEMSVDEHFIIDRHPEMENVWLVGGGSGHGFKHGPVVGEYVARRILGQEYRPELESIFRLKAEMFE